MRTVSRPAIPVHDLTPRAGTVGGALLLVEQIDDDLAFRSPHRHAFTQLVLIEAGSGVHRIDFTDVPIRAGEVHLLAPGQVHEWRADPGLSCIALMFSEDVLDPIGLLPERLRELLLLGAVPISPSAEGVGRLRRLLESIREASSLAGARHLLAALLHDCVEALPAESEVSPQSSLTQCFMRDVLRSPDARLTVSSCAARLGVTTGYLAEQVVADTGSTPGRILRTAVAREAQRLLSGTDMSAAQISHRLGFNEASYFSRFFRREVGCTPTEYRELSARGDGHGGSASDAARTSGRGRVELLEGRGARLADG
ncbi:MAG: AraC family transcriptional regulator [Leucobacter sp.]